jgi:hypothetical protein
MYKHCNVKISSVNASRFHIDYSGWIIIKHETWCALNIKTTLKYTGDVHVLLIIHLFHVSQWEVSPEYVLWSETNRTQIHVLRPLPVFTAAQDL